MVDGNGNRAQRRSPEDLGWREIGAQPSQWTAWTLIVGSIKSPRTDHRLVRLVTRAGHGVERHLDVDVRMLKAARDLIDRAIAEVEQHNLEVTPDRVRQP